MTPYDYIQALPRHKRMAERKRLAHLIGVSLATMRKYTEIRTVEGKPVARSCPTDPKTCLALEKATNNLVSVAEWNPTFAVLVGGP